MNSVSLCLSALLAATTLGPGDYIRTLQVDGRCRSYLVHVPPKYDPKQPTPVGAGLSRRVAATPRRPSDLPGLNEKADKEGFIAVYPNGTGRLKRFSDLEWRQLLRLRHVEQGG